MGAMGRYIDGLGDVQRDRLITGQVWVPFTRAGGGGGCLLGHASGEAARDDWTSYPAPDWGIRYAKEQYALVRRDLWRLTQLDWQAATAFNLGILRFGDRVVRAIKLRAAKNHRPSPESVRQESAVEVGVD